MHFLLHENEYRTQRRRKRLGIHGFLTTCVVFCFAVCSPTLFAVSPQIGPATTAVRLAKYDHVYYVSQSDGSDEFGNGAPDKPWKNLGYALEQISESHDQSRIALCVAEGRYFLREMALRENLDLYGGFERSRWHRDIDGHPTVLSGSNNHRVLVGANSVCIDGFVIEHGSVRGRGAAILCDGVSPTITNNRFIQNRTLAPADWNPRYLHELAHDGGAISCTSGASPTILNNLFADNGTENGRGGAIAFHGRCAGEVRGNVFLNNTTGNYDSHRSSDGGAISIVDWSSPRIVQNVFINNRALNTNDGGGIFIALWSSPIIESNIFVDNHSTDDGGALFIGGQEHRYDRPPDPLPSRDEYSVEISRNLLYRNRNRSLNSGGMRIAMQARVEVWNNVLAYGSQLNIQESEVKLVNNTVVAKAILEELPLSGIFTNNIFCEEVQMVPEVPLRYSFLGEGSPGEGNLFGDPGIDDQTMSLKVSTFRYMPEQHVTVLTIPDDSVEGSKLQEDKLVNRIVQSVDSWGVVKSHCDTRIMVWGELVPNEKIKIIPTFQLRSDSQAIDSGSSVHAPTVDFQGNPRPSGKAVDVGAYEFMFEAGRDGINAN